MKQSIYLDYAAATPLDPKVLKVMASYFDQQFYNPSANYLVAQKVKADLDMARSTIAKILGAKSTEIIFSAGATEANNLAIHGVMRRFPGSNIVASAIEHDSVMQPANKYNSKLVPVQRNGVIDITKLISAIDDSTVLVSIMYANNEVGTVQPIHDIANALKLILKTRAKAGNNLPLYFHSDAAQAGNYLDLHVARLGVDMMSINGGKLYGPKQSGCLFIKTGTVLEPQILGGGQERGIRNGTENVAADIGLSRALEISQQLRPSENERLKKLQSLFIALINEKIPKAIINGSLKYRLPNNVHITIPGVDNERLLFELDEAGILAAAGSACSASNEDPSHVLRAMGISSKAAQSSIRFTMGRTTKSEQLQKVVDVLTSSLSIRN